MAAPELLELVAAPELLELAAAPPVPALDVLAAVVPPVPALALLVPAPAPEDDEPEGDPVEEMPELDELHAPAIPTARTRNDDTALERFMDMPPIG